MREKYFLKTLASKGRQILAWKIPFTGTSTTSGTHNLQFYWVAYLFTIIPVLVYLHTYSPHSSNLTQRWMPAFYQATALTSYYSKVRAVRVLIPAEISIWYGKKFVEHWLLWSDYAAELAVGANFW